MWCVNKNKRFNHQINWTSFGKPNNKRFNNRETIKVIGYLWESVFSQVNIFEPNLHSKLVNKPLWLFWLSDYFVICNITICIQSVCILLNILCFKVHIFWEGHKILRNLHRLFDRQYIGQIIGGDFAKFCGLLRIYEL